MPMLAGTEPGPIFAQMMDTSGVTDEQVPVLCMETISITKYSSIVLTNDVFVEKKTFSTHINPVRMPCLWLIQHYVYGNF